MQWCVLCRICVVLAGEKAVRLPNAEINFDDYTGKVLEPSEIRFLHCPELPGMGSFSTSVIYG